MQQSPPPLFTIRKFLCAQIGKQMDRRTDTMISLGLHCDVTVSQNGSH
jgi:hypothetical protein